MAGRKESMHSAVGFAAAVALLIAGNTHAQPLGQPQPQPGPGGPPLPSIPTAPAPQPQPAPGDPAPPPQLPGSGVELLGGSGVALGFPNNGLPARFSFVI